jgi:hypothetical protein
VFSKAIDIPPLDQAELAVSVAEMREAWQMLRENALGLPTGEGLKAVAVEMQETAERESTSVWVVSTMIGLAAVGAGVKLGQANIADYYRESLAEIRSGGLWAYYDRVSRPYMTTAANHLDPRQESHTERILRKTRLPRVKFALPAGAKS